MPTRAPTDTSSSSGRGCKQQPDYRGRTHLLLTTDHGRGRTATDWRDHGAKIAGADAVWIAFVSPRLAAAASGASTRH